MNERAELKKERERIEEHIGDDQPAERHEHEDRIEDRGDDHRGTGRAARIELRQRLRQQTIAGEDEWYPRIAEQERIEQRERADHSAERNPHRDPAPCGSCRAGRDLRPTAFGPGGPIGRAERGE